MLERRSTVALVLLLLGACSKAAGPAAPGSEAAPASRGEVVARVGAVEIREDDLGRAMARDPGASPARFKDPAARRELVDGLVRFELLVQAAERAGLTKDPDAVHALQQIAVTKLVNQELGAAASPDSVTKADVEREYAARRATEFTRPEAVEVRHIRISDEEAAARIAATARALPPADDRGFAALASKRSEDEMTRASGGALGFLDEGSRLPRPLVEAALALKAPGDVAGPVKTEAGYEILRLVSRRSAAVSGLDSVDEQIRQRLYREHRAKALEDLMARLRAATPVEIVDAVAKSAPPALAPAAAR